MVSLEWWSGFRSESFSPRARLERAGSHLANPVAHFSPNRTAYWKGERIMLQLMSRVLRDEWKRSRWDGLGWATGAALGLVSAYPA